MENEKELKERFWNLYNSCYVVKQYYPNIDFLYHDENFNRQCKLKTIFGEEIIYPEKPIGNQLFRIEWYTHNFIIKVDAIQLLIGNVYDNTTFQNYGNVFELFRNLLNEHEKLKGFVVCFKYR